VFVTVCSTGSFTRAAEHLSITKSAASQHVAALEREIGVQLLQRSTRRLAVTEAGSLLAQEARALLDQSQRLADLVRQQAARLTGVLRLTSSEDHASWVAPLIVEYQKMHPGMEVEYLPSDRLLDMVAEGLDLSLRATGQRDSPLRAAHLATFEVWCVASPAYLQERGTPQSVAELAAHAWIAFTPIPHPWTLKTRGGLQSVRLQRSVCTSSTAGGRALAQAGAGVFAGPQFVLETEVSAGRLVRILSDVRLPLVTLYAAWPGRHEPPAKTRAFIELAKSRMRPGSLAGPDDHRSGKLPSADPRSDDASQAAT
jgi:DNA-binding transcriptional LysR family regulator